MVDDHREKPEVRLHATGPEAAARDEPHGPGEDREADRELYVYNVHWDHRSQPSRERSAELLLDRLTEILERRESIEVLLRAVETAQAEETRS